MSQRERLTSAAVDALGVELDGWEVVAGQKLTKRFKFKSFLAAIAWMQRVATVADRLDHHPNWSNVYNQVTVELWTHDRDGLTALDAELARAMDAAASEP